MGRYINPAAIEIDRIVPDLYDFSKAGGLSIQGALTEEGRTELLEAAKLSRYLFSAVQRQEGQVVQEMETLYLERLGLEIPPVLKELVRILSEEYSEIYEEIAERAEFADRTFNSIGIHFYWVGSSGITPHRDYASDSNLVTIFVLSGNAPFYVCRDRQKSCSTKLESPPGAAIFMRAARNPEEQPFRPFHYIEGPLQEERYSIIIRNRAEDKTEPKKNY